MTLKGFLYKASGKISAQAFLSQHREWLENGEVKEIISPILSKVDTGEMYPTPALEEIRLAVYSHMMARESQIIEEKKEKDLLRKKFFASKAGKFLSTIYDNDNNIVTELKNKDGIEEEVELVKHHNMPQDAVRWIDRKLIDLPNCFGIIEYMGKYYSTVERSDSLFRVLKKPAKCACRKTAATQSRLSFGMKVYNDVARFSRG